MKKEVLQSICISSSATIKDAIRSLNETAQKVLFVVDSNARLLGVITDGDIRRGLIDGRAFHETVDVIMHQEYVALDWTTPALIDRSRKLLIEHNLSHLPIIDSERHIKDVVVFREIIGESDNFEPTLQHDNHVVIMAGGKGSRLDFFTKIFPKPLLPVGDKPAIEVIMDRFSRSGFSRFLYTLNYKKEYVKLFLKDGAFPYEIDWVEEQEFLGTAGSLTLLRNQLRDTFFVVNCDTILNVDFGDILRVHKEQKAVLTVVGCHTEINIPFGVLAFLNGGLEQIHEKPMHDVIINTGVYVLEPSIISSLPENTKLDMNELINLHAKEGHVAVYPVYGHDWFDLGQWDEYKNSISKLLKQ